MLREVQALLRRATKDGFNVEDHMIDSIIYLVKFHPGLGLGWLPFLRSFLPSFLPSISLLPRT